MILKALKYTRYVDQPRVWQIKGNGDDYAYFDNINLLVGKNASGKSRTLSIIKEVASLLSGKINASNARFSSQRFDLIFTEMGENNSEAQASEYHYQLELKEGKVKYEKLSGDDKIIFERTIDGLQSEALIWLNSDNRQILKDIDSAALVIASKSGGKANFSTFDLWGNSIKNYLFSDQQKKRQMIADLAMMKNPEQNNDITNALLYVFTNAKEEFGSQFVDEVKECMHQLGYNNITNISTHQSKQGYCIGIEEDGAFVVGQQEMSQGMFRALSMFIFIVYARLKGLSECVLIDDVGEGIDFDRSKRLISMLIKKVKGTAIQCFMSTNDRMVMNDIPLRYWSVIDRVNVGTSTVYDYTNSKEVFDDFKYASLNNSEFLTTDFYKEGFGEDDEDDQDENDDK